VADPWVVVEDTWKLLLNFISFFYFADSL